ncbi:MAG TPA: kynureninase, partial [Chitinophagaceae bacterium]|nr:kynureninase [Chitinophagaceae bacterium]
MEFKNDLAFAQGMDKEDILKSFRDEFIIPQKEGKQQIYFLGNSLGLQPKRTKYYIDEVLNQWASYGVEGFFEGGKPWLKYHDTLIKPLADIVGALPHEVVIMNALTVNLHLMMASFYQPKGKRNKIICEAKAFSSDQYMLETAVRQRGFNPDEIIIEIPPREDEFTIREEDIYRTIEGYKEELALVLWGGVNYYTGQLFNMEAITKAAHNAGALVGFDLAHAAGNVSLQLHHWNVDFACWCNYKYLNSGPGSVGAAFIHEHFHQDDTLNRLAGWWGYKKETQFKMQKGFDPINTAEGWQLSTPSPIMYAAHKASLEIFEAAGFENVVQKGATMAAYLVSLLEDVNNRLHTKLLQVITPVESAERGCQVSILMLQNGREVFEALSKNGVFADW